jgi:hypothetical protein
MLSAASPLGKREKLRSLRAALEQDQGQPQIVIATHAHCAAAHD